MAVMEPWDLKETPEAMESSAPKDPKAHKVIPVDLRDLKARPATMACKARPAR